MKGNSRYDFGNVLRSYFCIFRATFIPLLNWSWSPQILYPHLFVSRPLPYVLPYYNNFRPHVHQRTDPQARGLLLTPGVEARHSVHRDHGGYGGHSHDDSDTNTAIQTILHSLGKTGNDSVFTCPDTGVNATYPHPWDCSKYYLCEENQQVTFSKCLHQLRHNHNKEFCQAQVQVLFRKLNLQVYFKSPGDLELVACCNKYITTHHHERLTRNNVNLAISKS